MPDYKEIFALRIKDCEESIVLHDHLVNAYVGPFDFSDLLRAQVVNCLSALDYLVHELVRDLIHDSFFGTRQPTAALLNETVPVRTLIEVHRGVAATAASFQTFMVVKTGHQPYQEPEKIATALSLCWDENDKWKAIAIELGLPRADAITKLKLICQQRNRIAHEADIDPVTGEKYSITAADCRNTIGFVKACGNAILTLVTK